MMEAAAQQKASAEEVSVKSEPALEGLCIKREPPCWDDACVKDEPSCSGARVKDEPLSSEEGARGVSEAAAAARLYADHVVKEELVRGPELVEPHRALCAPTGQYYNTLVHYFRALLLFPRMMQGLSYFLKDHAELFNIFIE
jgi:hypothetical protein